MNSKRLQFLLLISLAAVLLSGCSSAALANSWPGLATDGEHVYLAAGQHVYAIRISDGREVWRYPGKANGSLLFIAPPVLAPDGTILLGSAGTDHRLVAIDPSRIDVETNAPEEAWIFNGAADRWIAPPLILGEQVFAPNTDGRLYVIALRDGTSIRTAEREVELGGSLWAQPASDGERVYVAGMDHKLYAVGIKSFEFAWPAIDLGGAIPGSPLVTGEGELYVGSFASEVIKVSSQTGEWQVLFTSEEWVWSGPVTVEDRLYFGDLAGNFYALDSAGELLWSIQPDGPVVGGALVMPEYVVFATESGSVYAVDQEGKIVWQRTMGGPVYTTPVAGGERIFVAPMKAEYLLSALDSNGNQVWNFQPE